MTRLLLIGVDGFNPENVSEWLNDLPHINTLQNRGLYGVIRSLVPPASPHAWIASQSGRSPGSYGIWDNVYRDEFTYKIDNYVDSSVIDMKIQCLHYILPRIGQKIAMIDVPGTFPAPEIPGGYCLSSGADDAEMGEAAWPAALRDEIGKILGRNFIGKPKVLCTDQRVESQDLLKAVYTMDEQRVTLLKYFLHERNCDYVFGVLPGLKYVCRYILGCCDEKDYVTLLRQYYSSLDQLIGRLLETDDDTAIFVFSPYSKQPAGGCINLNEWLIDAGYLTLKSYPRSPMRFTPDIVDWNRTYCWSKGKMGQIYFNVKGREPFGIVDRDDLNELILGLSKKAGESFCSNGATLHTTIIKRDEVHSGRYCEYGPDVFACFDHYRWNTDDGLGNGRGQVISLKKIREANGMHGYFCLCGPGIPNQGNLGVISLLCIAPTVMDILRLEPHQDMEESSVLGKTMFPEKKKVLDKDGAVRSRLEALGY